MMLELEGVTDGCAAARRKVARLASRGLGCCEADEVVMVSYDVDGDGDWDMLRGSCCCCAKSVGDWEGKWSVVVEHGERDLAFDGKLLQRSLNLYLYTPPTSAHPPSCFNGTTIGNILCLSRQNPYLADYRCLVSKFVTHLKQGGYTISDVETDMLSSTANINRPPAATSPPPTIAAN
jgi:hypothetical protein